MDSLSSDLPICPDVGSRTWPVSFTVAAVLAIHAGLAFHALRQHMVTVDEGDHVLAGLAYWQHGAFEIYHVNPPLVKMLAALPLLGSGCEAPLSSEPSQSQVELHTAFQQANAERYLDLFFHARYVIVALSVAGGWLIYVWSRFLFGPVSGLIAVLLWSTCPNVLAFAGVATVDLGCAVLGLLAVYIFWRYLRQPTLFGAVLVGAAIGLALLAKFTLLVLPLLYFFIWSVTVGKKLVHAWWGAERDSGTSGGVVPLLLRGSGHCRTLRLLDPVFGLATSLLVLNFGYGIAGTLRPLGDFEFRCRALTVLPLALRGDSRNVEALELHGHRVRVNRFRGSWLERIPVPVPAEFLLGLDEQKTHADVWFPAYLRGQWRQGGWWYYYLYALAIKVPLGTWLLAGLSAWLAWHSSMYIYHIDLAEANRVRRKLGMPELTGVTASTPTKDEPEM